MIVGNEPQDPGHFMLVSFNRGNLINLVKEV